MIRVSYLLYPGFQLLDVAGPLAVFEGASFYGPHRYAVELIAETAGLVASSIGTAMAAQACHRSEGCDILLVPGGEGAREPRHYAGLLPFIRQCAAQGRRVASICTGAFVLADAGLLAHRDVTTHWLEADRLTRQHPSLRVNPGRLYTVQDNIWTSAGITAGIDLALAMVDLDRGTAVSHDFARALLVDHRRTSASPQQSSLLDMTKGGNRFSEVMAWARHHLAEEICVEQLADRAALSVRRFTRAFTASVGIPPGKAIARLRLECARAEIEAGHHPLAEVARRSRFGSTDRMRRTFLRHYGETPRTLRG